MKTGTFLRRHWDALLASVAACVFVYLFTRLSGIGISPDSVHYESTASHIRNHFSFTDFNDEPLVNFPVGYPFFLALLSWLSRTTVLQLAPVLNALLLSGLIFSTSILLNGFREMNRWYKAAILSLIACSPCLLEIYAMLWSETLFLFLTGLALVAFYCYGSRPDLRNVFFAGIVVAVACVTRYAGVALLGTGLFLLLFNGTVPKKRKRVHLLLFTCIGLSLVTANLVRNKLVAGHSTGVREKALRTVGDNIGQAGGVLSEWLPFLRDHFTAATVVFVIVLLFGIALVVYRLLQQQYFNTAENVITVFFVAYSVFIIGMASVSRFEDLSGRLLSPLYIPLLVTATSWVVGWRKKMTRLKRNFVTLVLLLLLAAFHTHHYRLNAEAWEGIKDSGMPGYAEGSWRESAAVALVRANANNIAAPVYANANDAVYFLTGIHAQPLPHKEIETEIKAFLQQPRLTVIWFVDGENNDLIGMDFIKQHKKLLSVQEAENGAIYYFGD